MPLEPLGIVEYDSYHFAVENLPRSRAFYVDRLDFVEVARASDELVKKSGQESVVFQAGDARVCVSTPLNQGCKAARYLRRHPAGVMSVSFRVKDLDRARKLLEERGATFFAEPYEDVDAAGGRYRAFEIATPLGDVAYRFVERSDYRAFAPGFVDVAPPARPANRYGFKNVDHITSNLLTMKPLLLWYRDVLGFEEFWNIQFHTKDVTGRDEEGTGLKSIVMWDPSSGIKFATNEPLRPNFRSSQITKFVYDNMGPGIQHIAFEVPQICPTIEDLTKRGIGFLATHPAYYRALPERLKKLGITNVKESLAELERLQILVDGADDKYMLQIFLREAATTHDDERAGPFFYEIIQRAGDQGFGYGNFRALFESIEREQTGPRNESPPG